MAFGSILAPGVAALATAIILQVLRRAAPRCGLLDHPGGRKNHVGAIPLVGGLAVFLGLVVTTLWPGLPVPPMLAIGALILVAAGVWDDRHELSHHPKFIAQILAALGMVLLGDVGLSRFGNLLGLGEVQASFAAVPLTIFCVVGVINAVNMIDGLDGLAGGVVLLALGWLTWVAYLSHRPEQMQVLAAAAGAVCGFLWFNLRRPGLARASVFLGDAGSLVLGFFLAWHTVDLSQGPSATMPPMVAVWILGVPLLDTVTLMIRRKLRGRSPFAADREHLHHLLQALGCSLQATVWLMLTAAGLLGAIGVAGWRLGWPEPLLFYSFMALFALYFYTTHRLWDRINCAGNSQPDNPAARLG